jgi:hypothetical protein
MFEFVERQNVTQATWAVLVSVRPELTLALFPRIPGDRRLRPQNEVAPLRPDGTLAPQPHREVRLLPREVDQVEERE